MKRNRQPDFHKTKLRVGKILPKGRNVTDTSFKSKKIIMRDQLKTDPKEVPLKELLSKTSLSNCNARKETLLKIKKYIVQNQDSLTLHLADILSKIGTILLDDDSQIRDTTINAISTCVELLSDVQIQCFIPQLTTYLHCMMTHPSIQIQRDSLKLLDCFLNSHADLICHSTKLLTGLLNMISSVIVRKNVGKKRKLDDVICRDVTSQDYRMEVLTRIGIFIERLTKSTNSDVTEEDTEVYLDESKPAFLPIYMQTGLRPMTLDHPWFSADTEKAVDWTGLKAFMFSLVTILNDLTKGELVGVNLGCGNALDQHIIQNLMIVTQLLCCWSGWEKLKDGLGPQAIEDLSLRINHIVVNQLLKGFPYYSHDPVIGKKENIKYETKSVQLNLSICYLYSTYTMNAKGADPKRNKEILTYLTNTVGVGQRLSTKFLSLVLKTYRNFVEFENIDESSVNSILLALCGIFSDVQLYPSRKLLWNFFIRLTRDHNYKHLLDMDGMKLWFKILLHDELFNLLKLTDPDKELLKYIRQCVAQGCPGFVESFEKLQPDQIIELLKIPNSDVQETAISMIVTLPHLSADILQALSETISNPSFFAHTAVRLIRRLHHRFTSNNVPDVDYIYYLQFLINVLCDTTAIIEADQFCNNDEAVVFVSLQKSSQFNILPNQEWNRHSKIYEVCSECLFLSPKTHRTAKKTRLLVSYFHHTLLHNVTIPIHSLISILKLQDRMGCWACEKDLTILNCDLLYASLIFVSIASKKMSPQKTMECGVVELQESMNLDENLAMVLTPLHTSLKNGSLDIDEDDCEYILRMLTFLVKRSMINPDNGKDLVDILNHINEICYKNDILREQLERVCCCLGLY